MISRQLLSRCQLQISHTWSKSHHDRTSVEVVERRRVLLEVEYSSSFCRTRNQQ
jgi:hypothetical protein